MELKPLEMTDVSIPSSPTVTGVRVSRDVNNWFDEGEFRYSDTFPRYENMLKAFGEYVLGERKNPYSLDYELELFKTVMKCCGVENDKI